MLDLESVVCFNWQTHGHEQEEDERMTTPENKPETGQEAKPRKPIDYAKS
jgi:hypothetical protein